MGTTVATKKITIEVEIPEDMSEDFIKILREEVWELYLTYKWLQLPEANPKAIGELAREAKRRATKETG